MELKSAIPNTSLLRIYSLCMYLYPLHNRGKQSIQRDGICVLTCVGRQDPP